MKKCRTIHRFSYRKNVKLFATGEGEMFRDVSKKKDICVRHKGKSISSAKLSNSLTN